MDKKLRADFANPGSAFRGAPFWAWNGKLNPEELRRQIRIMHRMGLGGFFMHSRVGLDTAYLSDDWFDCVNACIDEAEKLDMQAWLYDEDRWPSGAAGGLVTRNPKYRMRHLTMQKLKKTSELKWDADTVAVFTGTIRDGDISGLRQLKRGKRPGRLAGRETILRFQVEQQEPSSWYNDQTYLDTMNHAAVKEFIKVTHEAYRKRIGRQFGKRVPGIFTDEPNHGGFNASFSVNHNPSVPWTGCLPSVFRKRYGYDIISRLPEIFLNRDGEEISTARYHFHDCSTHLFVDAFARQIGDWCDKNNMLHTGHVLAEGTLSSQTTVVGNCMRFYEHMQAPGMDILTEYAREYDTAKQVSSAARQFGRKWRLTETYGCTGWDFPFAGHKAIGDWQVALGINLRCQHLSWYTMEGQAKRDYPAGIFYQSPWWELYPKVEDYFARIHSVITRGVEVRDILVIHPVESAWLLRRSDQTGEAGRQTQKYDSMLIALRDSLHAANLDFDYGDEEILSRHGKVTGKGFRVAKATYKAIIVPPLLTIRSSTLKLLKRFRKAGGTVVFAGKVPAYVDALPSDEAKKFALLCSKAPSRGPALAQTVDPECRRVSITDPAGREIGATLHLLREDKENYYLFVCNTGHTNVKPTNYEPRVSCRTAEFPSVCISGFADCAGTPVEFDCTTGEILETQSRRKKDGWAITTSLPVLGSRLFMFPKKKKSIPAIKRGVMKTVQQKRLSRKQWDITLSENNCLVLDRPRFKIGNHGWHAPDEILHIDTRVRDALGIPHRGGRMCQPWTREKKTNPKRIPVQLEYRFDSTLPPTGDLFLAVEQAKTFSILVNGTEVTTDVESGWWCDRSLIKVPVDPNLIKTGENLILLECEYTEEHPGLEIVYLLGNFGAAVKGSDITMTGMPTRLKTGDWCRQGLPFYSGTVAYRTSIRQKLRKNEKLFVKVPAYSGVAVRVLVNGSSAGVIAWEPNEVEITDLLEDGTAELAIEVVGHRRNSHGPLHLKEKNTRWFGPGQFIRNGDIWSTGGNTWSDDYQLVPCGLMQAPALVVRK